MKKEKWTWKRLIEHSALSDYESKVINKCNEYGIEYAFTESVGVVGADRVILHNYRLWTFKFDGTRAVFEHVSNQLDWALSKIK